MQIGTNHTRPDTAQPVTEFETALINAGMPDKRAAVYARSVYGNRNVDIANELGISEPAVTDYLGTAEDDIEEAGQLTSLTRKPDYVNTLSEDMVETIYESDAMEGYLGFSIHNPAETGIGYKLGGGTVIEGFYVSDADTFLLIHHERHGHAGDKTGILVEPNDLIRFLYDWVFQNRLDIITTEGTSDKWFLTGENREPEWLEEELGKLGIETVEATTDGRFVSPLSDDGVYCGCGVKSGRYRTGYKIAYQPTDGEIAESLAADEISEETAEEVTRKTSTELRDLLV